MKILRKLFRLSWLVTIPIAAVTLVWASATVERYMTFGVRHDATPFKVSLSRIGEEEAWNLYNRVYLAVDPRVAQWRAAGAGLKVVELFARNSELAKLNSDLPYSGFEYVKGKIKNGNKIRKSKLRYRGDFLQHWWSAKKSYRVKTKKEKLYSGMRAINLIVPKFPAQMNNYLGYQLATQLGIIAPRSEMVNLIMNGEWRGVHQMVEQLDESTLRNHGLMPGDLYKGELAGKDGYAGVSGHIFDHPGLWEKVAFNNHYPLESTAPLERLLELLRQGSSIESQRAVSKLLDIEAWARFGAYETLTQTMHYGISHNWRIYYDPAREKLMPVIWDPDAWHPVWMPKPQEEPQYDLLPGQMQKFLHQNGDYLRAKERVLREFFLEKQNEKFLEKSKVAAQRVKAAIRVDPFVHAMPGLESSGSKEKIEAIDNLLREIARVFSQVEGEYLYGEKKVLYSEAEEKGTYELQVEGRGALRQIQFLFSEPANERSQEATVVYWADDERTEVDLSAAVTTRGNTTTIDLDLIPQYEMVIKERRPAWKKFAIGTSPGYYEIKLGDTRKASQVWVDRGGGLLKPAVQVANIEWRSFQSLHQIATPAQISKPLVWSELVRIDQVQHVYEDVMVVAGTRVELSPGASIIFHGRVTVMGSANRLVHFSGVPGEKEPWGSVVLKGEGANNSLLKGCVFKGGSGYKTSLSEYSAMLSIHEVSGVVIEDCEFRDNFLVDDMLHTVYSELTIRNSVFEGAFSDAVDLDVSTSVIEGSTFNDNGNDGLDLMTTDALVVASTFSNNGDKGISAGEGSRLIAIDSEFSSNEIGVQVKDGTLALLGRLSFVDNTVSIDAYKKNWRYGAGGQALVLNANIAGSPTTISADSDSEIELSDHLPGKGVVFTGSVFVTEKILEGYEFEESEKSLQRTSSSQFRDDHMQYWDRLVHQVQ